MGWGRVKLKQQDSEERLEEGQGKKRRTQDKKPKAEGKNQNKAMAIRAHKRANLIRYAIRNIPSPSETTLSIVY